MPDPSPRKATPPPSPNRAKARDILKPPADDVDASLEPTDDLRDYIVPPDPEPEAEVVAEAPAENKIVATDVESGQVTATPQPTTADTELVHRLQQELAAAQARLSERQSDVRFYPTGSAPTAPQKGDKVLIHVREDGFTANGRVWYVGQELEFTVGAPNWEATLDRKGNSWTLLDDASQLRQYGKVMFGHGPWPGLTYADEKAAVAEARRGREAPTITQLSSLNTP